MLFSNTYVKSSIWKFLHHVFKGTSRWHCRRYTDNFLISFCQFNDSVPEDVLVFWRKIALGGSYQFTRVFVKFPRSVVTNLILFSEFKSFSFSSYNMQKLRTLFFLKSI